MYTYIDHDLKQRPRQKCQQGQWKTLCMTCQMRGAIRRGAQFFRALNAGKKLANIAMLNF